MKTPPNMLFAEDEKPGKICAQWTRTDLLLQPAIFFLKDICPLLELTTPGVIAHVRTLTHKGLDPYVVMGVRKVWNLWYVRMKVFAPYYQAHFKTGVRRIPSGMDANTLLALKGVFLLSQVCKLIPFSSNQLRHQARKTPKQECGIFKHEETYLVQMAIFGPWLSRLWQMGFEPASHAETQTIMPSANPESFDEFAAEFHVSS